MKSQLTQVLKEFDAPIRHAFGYGSGVFQQKSNDGKMIDLVFAVTHPAHWHSLNMRQHSNHYSPLMRTLGPSAASLLQSTGAGVYYNPYIKINGLNIKYGVVGIDSMQKDLREWKTFYLAGRLQKPVMVLREDLGIRLACKQNHYNAVRTSLFLLPNEFREEELFLTIAGLSYLGDPRMIIKAENPNKVSNIVYSQIAEFRKLYKPIIDDLPFVNYVSDTSRIQQSDDLKIKTESFLKLPRHLIIKTLNYFGVAANTEKERISLLINSNDLERLVKKGVHDIVSGPAIIQSAKGFFTAGPVKSIYYLFEKFRKGQSK